ncbi:hypothetical protein PHYBLDRAFT_69527 [Phycomyces blakesleeanus NRRL 1555(-)]|uniref:Uncharacterized protein n=1 Tax=Phycomyces blakesleeanus (strain ATCC 8743b / DSM 1359 / FGSC 10004 / NBRC 33097 / NRRL 1555) TaxID=763407 RepID=A0A167LK75_PHYB8|nr:hypothetical protein PHYBLDRAFT_69527 [Phycomyces blakesleeanus NRRL 1555(-)]OAD70636.1 hypothetical protein PHYBLDRAFT_69527 [Phycomyces blakesleeanus NRRL 1555(-)]|eukprot:XP_018288676.1 hypothetical protein PHYBLDRAFT_69527 [Phycomyces blakesleeanus NRRL 1555(-)]
MLLMLFRNSLREAAKGSARVDSFFLPIANSSSAETEIGLDEESDSADEVESKEEFKSRVKDAIIDLSKFAVPVISSTSEQQKLGVAEMGKYEGAYHYLYALINTDMKKMAASKFASDIVYKQKSTWYRARKIRQHAKEYLETRRISLGAQGKHAKRVSVLDDEDIKQQILEWFRSQPRAKRSIAGLSVHLKEVILPKAIGSSLLSDELEIEGSAIKPLSTDCLRRKLISWGFHFKHLGKVVYFDGHEREDVLTYRNAWSKCMMEYYQYSEKYDNVTPSLVSYPQLPEGVKQHVFVTHDESTFYANDYQKYAWVEDGESYCLPKSEGRSIMISEFQCPCHGTMRGYVGDQYKTSRVVFYPGAQYEGYWKKYEVIESRLHKNKKYKKYFIGLRGILQQRSMYRNEAERYSLKRSCNNVAAADSRCCTIHIMERQPDFANQKSALEEIVEGSGHKFELYPKYHCECNWIERYWEAAKKEARRECDYSFQSLNRKINSFLDSVCPPEDDVPEKIRRYFHKSFAYINAYSLGHDAEHAFEIVKQFSKLHKSHQFSSIKNLRNSIDFRDLEDFRCFKSYKGYKGYDGYEGVMMGIRVIEALIALRALGALKTSKTSEILNNSMMSETFLLSPYPFYYAYTVYDDNCLSN